MNQDRIDRIVEELEQYLPTSAQALLQELIEGLRKAPEEPMDLKTLLSILFLELKNELEPKKHVVQHFPSLCNKSYGESKDENIEKAREIINRFL